MNVSRTMNDKNLGDEDHKIIGLQSLTNFKNKSFAYESRKVTFRY